MITNTEEQLEALSAATTRLAAYAEQFEHGDVVDLTSGLTADDLKLLVTRLREVKSVVSIREIDLSNPDHIATLMAERDAG
jgi:hypothetical protein